MKLLFYLVILLCCIITGATAQMQEDRSQLRIVGEEYAPFSYETDDGVAGLSVDLINNLTSDTSFPFAPGPITLMPWEEALNATVNGSSTLLLGIYRTPERESLMQWVGPIGTDSNAVFVRNGSSVLIRSADDLKLLKLGTVSGDAHETMLIQYGVPQTNITTADTMAALIPMVVNGSVDGIFYGEQAGKWIIKEETGNDGTLPVAIMLGEQRVWFGLSPDTPVALVDALQSSLEKMQAEQAKNSTL